MQKSLRQLNDGAFSEVGRADDEQGASDNGKPRGEEMGLWLDAGHSYGHRRN